MVKNLLAMQETRLDPWIGKILWRRKWQLTLEKSHGQRKLAGYSPWGHKRSDMTEHTCEAHTHTRFYIYRGEKSTVVSTATHGQKNPMGMTSQASTLAFLDPASLAPLLTLPSDSFQNKGDSTVCRLQGKEERGHLFFWLRHCYIFHSVDLE